MGSSRTKQMVIWQFVDHPTQRTRYLDLSIVSLRNMKEQCSKICYTWQYDRPVGLYSLWNSLQSIIEVVAILKTLHQDLIGGFQNNDLAEIQSLKIAEFWEFNNLISYSGLPNLSSQILACSTLAGKPSTKKPLDSGCFAIASNSRSVTSSCENHSLRLHNNHLSVDLNLGGFIHVLNHLQMSVLWNRPDI